MGRVDEFLNDEEVTDVTFFGDGITRIIMLRSMAAWDSRTSASSGARP
jgi:hypothetical protein